MHSTANSGSGALLLEARGITKYFGAVTALEGVNLKLSQGEVLGVVGDNGAGKSTLMKVLSGLFRPSEGEIMVAGPPGPLQLAARLPQGRDRDGLSGPGAGREHADLREHLSWPRTWPQAGRPRPSSITRKSRKLAAEHLDRLQIHVKSRRSERRGSVRRAAPGRRHRPGHRIRRQGRHHGRADRGARDQGGRQGARPHQAASRITVSVSSSSAIAWTMCSMSATG